MCVDIQHRERVMVRFSVYGSWRETHVEMRAMHVFTALQSNGGDTTEELFARKIAQQRVGV
jgi:hypothetical protein